MIGDLIVVGVVGFLVGDYAAASLQALMILRGCRHSAVAILDTQSGEVTFKRVRPGFLRRALAYAWIGVTGWVAWMGWLIAHLL